MKEYAKTTLGKIRREYKSAMYAGDPCAIPSGFIERMKKEPDNTPVVIVIDGESLTFQVTADQGAETLN